MYKLLLVFILFFSFTSAEELDVAVMFEKAYVSFEEKDYKTAFEGFSELVDYDLTDKESHFYLARTSFLMKRYKQAESSYRFLLQNFDDDPRIRLELARTLFLLRRFGVAAKEFEKVLTNKTRPPRAVLKRVKKYLQVIASKSGENELYDEALNFFKSGDFEKAYEKFTELLQDDYTNKEVNFYLARSAFESGKLEIALSAYERVLLYYPNEQRIRLEYARTLFLLGLAANAKDEFKIVLDSKPPKEVAKKIKSYLLALEPRRIRNALGGSFSFGVQHATNVNNTSGNSILNIPSLGLNIAQTAQHESDTSHIEQLGLLHTYDFGELNGYMWQNRLSVFAQHYLNFGANNLLFTSFQSGLSNYTKKYNYYLPVVYEKFLYGSDDYLDTYAFTPTFGYVLPNESMLSVRARYGMKKFVDTVNSNRDASQAGIWTSLSSSTQSGHWFGEVGYSMEQKENTGRTDVDFEAYNMNLQYQHSFTDELSYNVNYGFRFQQFNDTDTLFLSKREDQNHVLGIGFSEQLATQLSLNGTYNYIVNTSNHDPFDYTKSQFLLNVNMNF